jgi:hypothetical protein
MVWGRRSSDRRVLICAHCGHPFQHGVTGVPNSDLGPRLLERLPVQCPTCLRVSDLPLSGRLPIPQR